MKQNKYTDKDDQEVYFDCNILEKFDENHEFDKFDESKPKDKNIDLMDFISNCDFSSVGGVNNSAPAKKPEEEKKAEITPFDSFFDAPPTKQP
jgi:hypothetical protein